MGASPDRQPVDASTPVTILSSMVSLHYGGLAIARTLGRWGVPVYWVHPHDSMVATRSRYVQDIFPLADDATAETTVEYLLRVAQEIGGRSVLIPVDDRASLIVAEQAKQLEEAFLFPHQRPETNRGLSSKTAMSRLCETYGVPTPMVALPRSRQELDGFLETAVFPVVVKRVANWANDGLEHDAVVIAADADAVRGQYRDFDWATTPNALLQEYIPGGQENIWMFNGYFSEASQCLVGATARKLRQAPPYTGVTTLGVCAEDEDLARSTADFLSEIGYVGIVDLGYKWDARDGRHKLLDVNPRVGATFRLFADSNDLDVVRALYLDLTGQPVTTGATRNGRKWLLEPSDVMSSLHYVRDGHLTFAEWRKSLRGVEEAAWFAKDDLRPFFSMLWDSVRRSGPKLLELRR